MNKKLLSGLCAAVLLSGLVGCGPKEPKEDTTTSTSTNETKETENNTTTTTNNSEVTEKNFKDFPETDEKYFTDDIFNGCSSLEEVTFPEGTKSIGTLVFWGTESIKSITIPASVTEITDLFYFVKNCNPDVEIHTPKGSKAEEVANSLGLKVVNN